MQPKAKYYEFSDLRALRNLTHNNIELYLISCGREQCDPGHSFGPGVRDKILVHFIVNGKGIFRAHGKEYILTKNQAFAFFPDEEVEYIADSEDPWTYTWVGFNGAMALSYLEKAGITPGVNVFDFPEDSIIPEIITSILNTNKPTYSNELLRQAYLLQILATLISYNDTLENDASYNLFPHKLYTEQALQYISSEYMHELHVSDIADRIGITRSYLVKCFNHTLNISPKQYIIKFRMDKACELLKTSSYNITEIAAAVGYNNSLTFSKAFKTYWGVSPVEWRNKNLD